jgi:hypothetical protein
MVDHANVIFREVGHSIVGFFSADYQAFGGAIGQIALPLIMLVSFYRSGHALGFATSTVWISENLINIGHMVGDPGAKSPPFIGGADHDWIVVFNRLGLLHYENNIVATFTTAAWIGMGLACLFVFWRTWQSRRLTSPFGRLASAR